MASPSAERNAIPFPERIGRYELLLPIGTGGMATVFLARASGVGGFERHVAIKIIHAHLRADEDSKLHLLDEARLAARIRHPNVVPVLEVGDDPFGVYLVMDYVEGDSLAGVMRVTKAAKERLPLRIVARILSDSLSGLHAAHELLSESGSPLGLVHRDFSPQNILVGADGMSRLSDFSVAKAGERAVRTRTGLVKGKIAYMSPEQARGHSVDRRCDVWAAGVVAWELIAWRRMHKKADAVSTLLSVVTEQPPRLSAVYPEVPKALDEVVSRALSTDVEKRTGSALDLRRQLEEAFREAGGIADAQEVGEFVQRLFGQKLQERRARSVEVRKLRLRMDEIARPSAPYDVPESARAAELGVDVDVDDEDSSERTRRERPISLPGARSASHAVPEFSEGVTAERTLRVTAERAATDGSSRRRRIALGGLAVALVAGAAAFIGWSSANSQQAPAVEAENSVKQPTRPNPEAARALPNEAPRSKPDRNELPPSPAATVPPSTPGDSRAANRQPASSRRLPARVFPKAEANPAISDPKRAEPRSKAPTKLASDPYGNE